MHISLQDAFFFSIKSTYPGLDGTVTLEYSHCSRLAVYDVGFVMDAEL